MLTIASCHCEKKRSDKAVVPTESSSKPSVSTPPAAPSPETKCQPSLTPEQRAELLRAAQEKADGERLAQEAELDKQQALHMSWCESTAKKLIDSHFATQKLDAPAQELAKQLVWLGPRLTLCEAARKGAGICNTLPEDARPDCTMAAEMSASLRRNKSDWRFGPTLLKTCQENAGDAKICEQAKQAVFAGDAARCPEGGVVGSYCRALAALDASKCADLKVGAREQCQSQVRMHSILAKGGLAALATEGNDWERAFAQAAQGDPASCVTLSQAQVVEACRAAPNPTLPPTSK